MQSQYDTTLDFIKKAHADQKYGSQPYWTHPVNVDQTGKLIFGIAGWSLQASLVALLHDVVEDTIYDLDYLSKLGYSKEVVAAVALVTKDNSLTYFENIERIISSGNELAMKVKLADNYVNFTGDKSHWDEKRARKSNAKYKKSIVKLAIALGKDQNWVHSDLLKDHL